MLFGVVLALPDAAHAVGSGMPWEGSLTAILESIERPVARIVAVIIIVITGLSLAFGEVSDGFRRLIQIVFGLSIVFAATSVFLSYFSFAGGAPRTVAIVNGTLAAAVGLDLQLWVAGIVVRIVGHAAAVCAARKDAAFMDVLMRHVRH